MGDGVDEYLKLKDLDMAKADLEEMIDHLESCIKRGGFENDDIIFLIKMWSKANVRAGLTLIDWEYWRLHHEPAKLAGNSKRSVWLRHRLEDYQSILTPGYESHQLYYNAREALLNFVWDYHRQILDDVNRSTDFLHQLVQLAAQGVRGLMDEDIYISIQKANHIYRPDAYRPSHRRNGRRR
jgi:hypothetical protein